MSPAPRPQSAPSPFSPSTQLGDSPGCSLSQATPGLQLRPFLRTPGGLVFQPLLAPGSLFSLHTWSTPVVSKNAENYTTLKHTLGPLPLPEVIRLASLGQLEHPNSAAKPFPLQGGPRPLSLLSPLWNILPPDPWIQMIDLHVVEAFFFLLLLREVHTPDWHLCARHKSVKKSTNQLFFLLVRFMRCGF